MKKSFLVCVCALCLYFLLATIGCFFAYIEWQNFKLPNNLSAFTSEINRAQRIKNDLYLARPFIKFNNEINNKLALIDNVLILKPIIIDIFSKDEKNFLIVMQNNTEIRASGGIWGSYGKLKIKNGKVVSFNTDDTYTIDKDNIGKFSPPNEVADIIGDQWRFWNANWSPDFAKSVEQGLYFYNQVDNQTKFDGVIGPNIDLAINLLDISGPIKIDGYDFELTKDNFIQKMVYDQVSEAVLASKEIPTTAIKPEQKNLMLAEIAIKIFTQALKSGKENELLDIIYKSLQRNDMQIYLSDKNQMNIINHLGWAQKIDTRQNFAMLIDSNLGSKLDFIVNKDLKIKETSKGVYEATISYNNDIDITKPEGNQAFKNYRTFIRLYVPKGSTLISQIGGDNQFGIAYDPSTDCEYISAILTVAPNEKREINFLWQVPENIKNNQLSIQKQSGSHIEIAEVLQ